MKSNTLMWVACFLALPCSAIPPHVARPVPAHLPLFQYPPLALAARIQGRIDLVLTVEDGRVVAVDPLGTAKDSWIPQLARPSIDTAKRIEFYPHESGKAEVHIVYKITDLGEGKLRVEYDPESETFTVEHGLSAFCVLPAVAK